MRDIHTYRRLSSVEHDLGVAPGEHDESDDPLTVPDRAPSEQELIDRRRLELLLPCGPERRVGHRLGDGDARRGRAGADGGGGGVDFAAERCERRG